MINNNIKYLKKFGIIIEENKNMKKIILVVALFVGMISANAQEVKWVSFEKAIELNKKNPKPILVDLYTDWCGWCKRMDATTYKNKTIVDYINKNFYAVKMDGEGKKDITFKGKTFKYVAYGKRGYHELAATIMNGRMSFPSTAFFNSKEQLIKVIPGYLQAKSLEKFLVYYNNDSYKKNTWEDFVKGFKSKL